MSGQSRARRRGVCAICGRIADLTSEHIPPKSLFVPRPVDLLTVFACAECNGSTSNDDEYFRNCIAMSSFSGDSEPAVGAREAALRSVSRSRRHIDELREAIDFVYFRDEEGNSGQLPAFRIDEVRIKRVVRKICRGIYFHETGSVMNQGIDIAVYFPGFLNDVSENVRNEVIQTVLSPLQALEEKRFASGLFRYTFCRPDKAVDASVFVLIFYHTLEFVCLAVPTIGVVDG